LRETRERLLKHQRQAEATAAQLQRTATAVEAKIAAPLPPNDSDLARQLAKAQTELAAVQEELAKKTEGWRINSLKRHAELNKLEQALKVAQKNEGLLKKKADMLELTVLSHQKSMDKGRANMVNEQLREHNERLEQQTAIKDMHAQATQRATFQQTYDRQMNALDGKLNSLK